MIQLIRLQFRTMVTLIEFVMGTLTELQVSLLRKWPIFIWLMHKSDCNCDRKFDQYFRLAKIGCNQSISQNCYHFPEINILKILSMLVDLYKTQLNRWHCVATKMQEYIAWWWLCSKMAWPGWYSCDHVHRFLGHQRRHRQWGFFTLVFSANCGK